jgi:hypothetical protein
MRDENSQVREQRGVDRIDICRQRGARELSDSGRDKWRLYVRVNKHLMLIDVLDIECGSILRVGLEVQDSYSAECGNDGRE